VKRFFEKQVLALLACSLSLGGVVATAQAYQPDSMVFDGELSLDFPPSPRLVLADGGTLEFWVAPNWEADPGYDPVIIASAGPEGPAYLVAMLRERDGIVFAAGDEEAVFLFDFTDGQLHHVAISQYADGIEVYVDGRQVGNEPIMALDLPVNGVWLGSIDGENNAFRGVLAGLRLWQQVVPRETLVAFALRDIFDDDHPQLDALAAMSDFSEPALLLVE
jgi:hypothetical protein